MQRIAIPCSRLDAVAHGGNPQDRAASLFPVPVLMQSLMGETPKTALHRCSLFPS
ncbi:hypothetical protein [Moorena producens]|uniref:hypothetical protein n=1 Tax=Moorena producens TaxID=1155739 RepID=UPI000A795C89|nr:hypothetical protein [Moorena producens]